MLQAMHQIQARQRALGEAAKNIDTDTQDAIDHMFHRLVVANKSDEQNAGVYIKAIEEELVLTPDQRNYAMTLVHSCMYTGGGAKCEGCIAEKGAVTTTMALDGAQAETSHDYTIAASSHNCQCAILTEEKGPNPAFYGAHVMCKHCAKGHRGKFEAKPTSGNNNNCFWYSLYPVLSNRCPEMLMLPYSREEQIEALKRQVLAHREEEMIKFYMIGPTPEDKKSEDAKFLLLSKLLKDNPEEMSEEPCASAAASRFGIEIHVYVKESQVWTSYYPGNGETAESKAYIAFYGAHYSELKPL
jgi:hypothetical protein